MSGQAHCPALFSAWRACACDAAREGLSAWGTTPGAEANKEMCIKRIGEILFNPGLMRDAEALYDRCSDKTGRTPPRASVSARSLLRNRVPVCETCHMEHRSQGKRDSQHSKEMSNPDFVRLWRRMGGGGGSKPGVNTHMDGTVAIWGVLLLKEPCFASLPTSVT